jgi:putative molybdopterin biosynthesis protein
MRETRGLSQVALARSARLTRQSIGAIEAGRAMPAVDVALRLAKALECAVEELFATSESSRLAATPTGEPRGGRVALARIAGSWVSYPLGGAGMRVRADGIAAGDVELLHSETELRENTILMGCAPALGLLADRLNSRRGRGRFVWIPGSSTSALDACANGKTHVAGVHLVDERTGQENVADVRRHARADLVLVTLARWEQGLVVAPGNPKKLRRAADLARRSIRVVTREKGSGARRLLDRELRREGISRLARPPMQASGHLEVAHAVSIGGADAGIATRDASIAYGLDFVPLAEERYDLVFAAAAASDPRIARLLDALTTVAFRRELRALGYDVTACGERVAEIRAT